MAPESLSDALGLLYQGAATETAAQMKVTLFAGESPEAVEAERRRRAKTLNGYRVIHGLWRTPETSLVPAFEEKAEDDWEVHLGIWMARESRERRAAEINQWFGEQTLGSVTQAISPEDLGDGTAFCGVLVAAFAAPWAEPVFAGGRTRREIFYASTEERFDIWMMTGEASLDYAEDEDFQFLRIAYAGSTLGLHLLLPKRAAEAAEAFSKADRPRWQMLTAAASRRTVRLWIPKVNIRERIDWRAKFEEEFGLDRPFAPSVADFSNLAKHPEGPLYLCSLVQCVWVRWDERGTRAEASTAYSANPFGDAPAPVDSIPFVANHPFAYVIGDIARGRILFAGRIGRREQMPTEEAR